MNDADLARIAADNIIGMYKRAGYPLTDDQEMLLRGYFAGAMLSSDIKSKAELN